MSNICSIEMYKSEMKNMEIYRSQPNKTLNYICSYFIPSNSLSLYVYKKQSHFHHNPNLNPKSFPSKNNLKIKLIKYFNHVLLNLCHSPCNNGLLLQMK